MSTAAPSYSICPRYRALAAVAALLATLALTACADQQKKEEAELAKNSIVCQYNGERLVINYDSGEARLLMNGSDKITLYQIPTPSGSNRLRYSNGTLELRGKGMNLQLFQDGTPSVLTDCETYVPPPK